MPKGEHELHRPDVLTFMLQHQQNQLIEAEYILDEKETAKESVGTGHLGTPLDCHEKSAGAL